MGSTLIAFLKNFQKKWEIIRKIGNQKFIFIHINKTGGTSISKGLKDRYINHFTVKEAITRIGEKKFMDCVTFTVIRNPYSKVVSHYKFQLKENKHNFNNNYLGFNEWVKETYGNKILNKIYIKRPIMYAQQTQWLTDIEGNYRVNEIIYFENYTKDLQKFQNKYNINFPILHLNATKKDSYQDYYNEESKKIIKNHFSDDIKIFGYSF